MSGLERGGGSSQMSEWMRCSPFEPAYPSHSSSGRPIRRSHHEFVSADCAIWPNAVTIAAGSPPCDTASSMLCALPSPSTPPTIIANGSSHRNSR